MTQLPLLASRLAGRLRAAADGPGGAGGSEGPGADPIDEGEGDPDERLRRLVTLHFDFVWRSLRRLGVAPSAVDDAAQEVFWTAARKLDRIHAGSERAYLFAIALRFASDWRRQKQRQREVYDASLLEAALDVDADVEMLVDQKRARDLLDVVLDALPLELRAVLMLSEGEQLTMAEIAAMLEIPPGTVASRLRRAREVLEIKVDQLLREGRRPETSDDKPRK